jgi:uncharacterized membrane protein
MAAGDLFPKDFWSFDTVREITAAGIRDDSGNGWIHKVFLHYWIDLGGLRDAVARLPSVVFGVAGVLLTFLVARALQVARTASLIAAGLVAAHPLLIRSSQEIRGYTLATALSLLSSLVLLHIIRAPGRRLAWLWAAYTACLMLSFLCHYLVLTIVVAHAAYLAAVRPPRRVVVGAALAGLSLLGLLLVWYAFMGKEGLAVASLLSQDFKRRAALSLGGSYALPATPRYLLAGLSQLTLAQYGNQLQETGVRLRVLTFFLVVPGVLTGVALRALPHRDSTQAGWFLVACSFTYAPLAVAASILQGHNILFSTRYAQFAVPYTAILLGVAVASASTAPASRWLVRLLFGAHAAMVLASMVPAYDARIGGIHANPRPRNPYSDAAEHLAAEYREGDVVHIASLLDAKKLNLYLRGMPIRQRIDGALPAHQMALVRAGQARLVFVGE